MSRWSTFLRLVGASAALAGSFLIRTRPELGVGVLVAALVAFLVAERTAPPEPALSTRPAPAIGYAAWLWLAAGALFCLVSAFAVLARRPAWLTHAAWGAGLASLGAAALWARWREGGGIRRPRFSHLAVLLFASALLFGWRLTVLPREVHGDDAEVGLDAIRLLGNFDLLRAGWFDLPMFHALPTAIGLRVFGIDLLGLRMTSLVLGALTVLLVYAVARRLWGERVALLSALFLVSARFFIHLSRAGYHYVDTPFLSVLALWLLLLVWYEHRLSAAIWCGMALGLGIQTYYASRLVPLLLAVTCALWLASSEKSLRRRRAANFAIIVVVALAIAAPMLSYFSQHWDDLWSRTRDTSIFTPRAREHLAYSYGTNDLGAIFWIQLRKAAGLFHLNGDTSVQYGYPGPLLDPVSGALFVLGLAAWGARLLTRRGQAMLLWLLVPVIAGAALTIDTPFYPRISGAMPFAAITVAYGLHRLTTALGALRPIRFVRGAEHALLAAVLAVVLAANIRTYFIDYAPRHRHSIFVEMSEWIRAHGADRTTYLVGGAPRVFVRHGTIQFLTYGYETRDILNLEDFLRTQRPARSESAFVILPNGKSLIPKLQERLGPLEVREHGNGRGAVFYTALPVDDS